MRPNQLILSCLLFFCSILQISAQTTMIGFKGGLSIPSIRGGNNEVSQGYSTRLGPNFGVFVDYGINEKFSIQVELNYAGQGGKRNGMQPITQSIPGFQMPPGSYLYADFNNEAILNYLELPVLAKYKWGDHLKFYVEAGLYVGYLLSAKEKTSGMSTLYVDKNGTPLLLPPGNTPIPPISFDGNTDVKDQINKLNFGVTGGGGIALPVNVDDELFFDARFAYGITNIQKDTEVNGKSHTGNVVLSLGYAFHLGGK